MAGEAVHELDERSWLYRPSFPDDWERMSLLSMARWVNGLAFRDFQFSDTGKPVIKIAEIKGGITGQTKFTSQTFEDSVFVTNGDLLFSWSGQPETSIDVFWWRGRDGWLNQHIFKVTPIEDLDPVFFFYVLRYLKPNFIGIARNKQTTGLGHVTRRDLENIEAAYPPLAKQKTIAAVLGALDDKIELNRRMNATLEAMARALFQSWFVDFDPVRRNINRSSNRAAALSDEAMAKLDALFPDSFQDSELGPIPKGWDAKPLPDTIEVNPRRTLKARTVAPYLDMKNLPTQGHSAEEVINREFSAGTKFQNGDTLLARITPCLENGKTGYVDFLEDGQVGWGSTEYIVFAPKPPLPPQFGYILARSDALRSHAIQNMTGTSGRQRVPSECFNTFWLAVPPPNIARRFDELTAPLMAKIKANADQSRTLATLRDTLLPKLLSGELGVPVVKRS
ncbi:MAG: restriction endonuclease subunit S [Verrucomicrobiae bacterium]|nr:restriction endonuclease subunit S [Verrucomicrobiae bacterium]